MSETVTAGNNDAAHNVQIPLLHTSSFRAVVNSSREIFQPRAKSNIETTNGTLCNDLREYGASWEQTDQQSLALDYNHLPGLEGPANPLDKSARQYLLDEIQTRLKPVDLGVDGGFVVTSPTILMTVCQPLVKNCQCQTSQAGVFS